MVILEIPHLPQGAAFEFQSSDVSIGTSTVLNISTTSSTPKGRYLLLVKGTSSSNMNSNSVESYESITAFILDVTPSIPSYELELNITTLTVRVNESGELEISAYSKLGFDEPITITFEGVPDDVNIVLTPQSIIPTAKAKLSVVVNPKTDLKNYNITVKATSNETGIARSVWFDLKVIKELPKFNIVVRPSDKLILKEGSIAEVSITITPIAGYNAEVKISVHGLEGDMTWNSEVSPILLDQAKTVTIKISNLHIIKEFILRFVVNGENYIAEQEFELEVVPSDDDDGNPDAGINNDLILIFILIILLIVIIFAFSKISRTTGKGKDDQNDNESDFHIVETRPPISTKTMSQKGVKEGGRETKLTKKPEKVRTKVKDREE